MNKAKTALFLGQKRRLFSLFAAALALTLAGCANVNYTRLVSVEEENHSTGVPYYDTSPYILLQKDSTGTWQSTVLYLPDHTKRNSIDVSTFLASNNSTFNFTNAILTDSSVTTDSSAVPAAVVQTAATVATAAAKVMKAGPQAPRPPSAYLFKIVRVNHRWGLVGASAPDIDTLKFGEGL